MKKYIIMSLLIFVPAIAVAGDHCTNPGEYTIDKRCYVTDEQKSQKPYNAVVKVENPNKYKYNCTGVIIKGEDNTPYLVTAKHCARPADTSKEFFQPEKVVILLQDGSLYLTAEPYSFGRTSAENYNKRDDWVVFKFKDEDKEKLKNLALEPKGIEKVTPDTYNLNARFVGYSALKIMSDEEIKRLKKEYAEYMFKRHNERVKEDEWGGIEVVTYILDGNWPELTRDDDYKLKVSDCIYKAGRYGSGCQGWVGSYGGPILDADGNVLGIVTRTDKYRIGGFKHAEVGNNVNVGFEEGTIRINKTGLPSTDETK